MARREARRGAGHHGTIPITTSSGEPARREPVAYDRTTDVGLTLLEMLIVLAVVAVATGATALSLGPRRDSAPAATAQQLAAAIQRAADRSIATGESDVLAVDGGGYTLGGPRRALPPGIAVSARRAVPVAVDGPPFDLTLTLTDGHERWRVSFDGWRAAATRDAP